eukprot:3311019-Amphidinium_carterae.1
MVKDKSYDHQWPDGRWSSKAAKQQAAPFEARAWLWDLFAQARCEVLELSLPFHVAQTGGHAPRQEGTSWRASSAFKRIALAHPEHNLRLVQPIGDERNLAAHFVYCTACGSYAEKA